MSNDFCVLGFSRPESHLDESAPGFFARMDGFGYGHLVSGERVLNEISDTPTGTLARQLPKTLPDHLENGDGTLIVSPRLREFLSKEVADVEFIPIHIFAGKKLISDEYQVAHLIHPLDAIDMDTADPKWRGSGKRRRMVRMNDRKLPLREDQIPEERKLFYLKDFAVFPVIRRSFGEALLSAGFTNIALVEVDKALARL